MDFKEIKNTKHYLYDNEKEFHMTYPDVPLRHNWRYGSEGEWVFTDDGFVFQILKRTNIAKNRGKKVPCIRTVCGTFIAADKKKEMLGEEGIAENIYNFSGTNNCIGNFRKRKKTTKELLFARYVASGIDILDAYKCAYPDAKNDRYIQDRTTELLKTEKILKEHEATPEYIIERYKTIADMAENDTHKLKALDSLAKMSGLFDLNESKSEKLEIWAGFSPEQLEGVKDNGKPELIASAKKDKKD